MRLQAPQIEGPQLFHKFWHSYIILLGQKSMRPDVRDGSVKQLSL